MTTVRESLWDTDLVERGVVQSGFVVLNPTSGFVVLNPT